MIKIKYKHESIGTLKSDIFLINGFWYWVPKSVIQEKDVKNKNIIIPLWFKNKMKPDLNYIY